MNWFRLVRMAKKISDHERAATQDVSVKTMKRREQEGDYLERE